MEIAIIVSGIILLIFFRRLYVLNKLRKTLKKGATVKFYIDEENYVGKVTQVDKYFADVEYLNMFGTYMIHRVSKSNIYPAW